MVRSDRQVVGHRAVERSQQALARVMDEILRTRFVRRLRLCFLV